MAVELEKGAFLCSIDTELAWGYAHLTDDPTDYEHWSYYGRVRESFQQMLEIMDRFDIPATFAFVGRLLVDPRDEQQKSLYPPNPQPGDDFLNGERLESAEFLDNWFAPELLEMVRNAKAPHEVGSHTFSHVISDEPWYTKELFEQDLAAARKHMSSVGWDLKSLVFPKNRINHLDVLSEQGFKAYRSVPNGRAADMPTLFRRVFQKLDSYLPLPPRVSHPVWHGDVLEVPATYYHRHTGGWARYQANFVRRSKLKLGLRRAAAQKALFHVWFHPYDIASDPKRLLPPLASAFETAARLRDAGKLDVVTMGGLSEVLHEGVTTGLEGARA